MSGVEVKGAKGGSTWTRAMGLVIGLSAFAAACDGAGTAGGGTSGEAGDGGDGSGWQCPSDAASLEHMNAATYAVVLQVRTGPRPEDVAFMTLGTAFAVEDRLLVTNAHITEFFNEVQGLQIEEVFGVQSGTGRVVKLLRALTHPDYDGNPLTSPDVGVLTSQEILPVTLELASPSEVARLRLGDAVQITGFPGDVNDIIAITPGTTIPQATSLSGSITAFRNHASDVEVTPENVDVIQHQAPTTPGTSGSAMVHCGRVIAANNAGTVKVVVVVKDGQTQTDRQAAAANNFGVHVHYVAEMIDLFHANAVQGFALPPAFVPANDPNPAGQPDPGGIQALVGTYQGGVNTPANASHGVSFTVSADGTVSGASMWPQTGAFRLEGEVDAQGNIVMVDDAQRIGFATGIYLGRSDAQGIFSGVHAEGDPDNVLASWAATR